MFAVRHLPGMFHVHRDLQEKIHKEAVNEVYEILEVSILIDSTENLAELLRPALDPEADQVGLRLMKVCSPWLLSVMCFSF